MNVARHSSQGPRKNISKLNANATQATYGPNGSLDLTELRTRKYTESTT